MTEKEMIKNEVQDVIVICINILADLKLHTDVKDVNIKMQKCLLEREKMSFCGNILKDISDIIQDICHERINVKTAISTLETTYILIKRFYDVISEENIGDSKNAEIRGEICEEIMLNLKYYYTTKAPIMLQLFLLIKFLETHMKFEDEWEILNVRYLEEVLKDKMFFKMKIGIPIYELQLKYFKIPQ